MKRILTFGILIVLLLALTGCSNRLDSGVIIKKRATPCYTYMQAIPVGNVIIPQMMIMPATYAILVQGTDEEGERLEEWWSVDAVTYSRMQVGMKAIRRGE